VAESLRSLGRPVHLTIKRIFHRPLDSLPSSESITCSVYVSNPPICIRKSNATIRETRTAVVVTRLLFVRLMVTMGANVWDLGRSDHDSTTGGRSKTRRRNLKVVGVQLIALFEGSFQDRLP